MNDEERLKEKLRAIEALFSGATTEGEREAADRARQRIAARLVELRGEPEVEWRFSLNPWTSRLFIALARRYGLSPYRYQRQRYTTLMVRASERFLRETFMPEYLAMEKTLQEHLSAVTDRVVSEVLSADTSEPVVVDSEPPQLQAFGDPPERK